MVHLRRSACLMSAPSSTAALSVSSVTLVQPARGRDEMGEICMMRSNVSSSMPEGHKLVACCSPGR